MSTNVQMAVRPEPAILKGASFTARLSEVSREPLPIQPLADLKYRRILIPGVLGGEVQFALLGFIGQALRLRGAEVTALMCDEFLPACTLQKVDHHEKACSRWCHKNAGPFAKALRLPHRWYSEFITTAERAECDRIAAETPAGQLMSFRWRGVDFGRHVHLSIDSHFKVGCHDPNNPAMVAKAYEFLRGAMYLVRIAERALEQLRIDKVFMEDGQKIDWGVFRSVAALRGIPVDVAMGSTRGGSITLERDRPGRRTLLMPEWPRWRDQPLTAAQRHRLEAYFDTRATVPYEGRSLCSWAVPAHDAEVRRRLNLEPAAGPHSDRRTGEANADGAGSVGCGPYRADGNAGPSGGSFRVGADAGQPDRDPRGSSHGSEQPAGGSGQVANSAGEPGCGPSQVATSAGRPGRGPARVFGMFPNLSYDAGLTSTDPAFPTAAEWVVQTIRFFGERAAGDSVLVVKAHPAELERRVLDPVLSEVRRRCEVLPPNVRLIPPESTLTAHDVIRQLDVALVYTSTVAVEAAYLGKPVVLVGGGPHFGMGITHDVATPAEYFELLAEMCAGRMPPAVPRAVQERYAYAVFFRSVLPVRFYSERELNITAIHLDRLADLAPGYDESLDAICRGILLDEPFTLEPA